MKNGMHLKHESNRSGHGRMRRRGMSLVPVVILMSIFAIISTVALRDLLYDIRRVNLDYLELAARTAARSGIELARRDLAAGDRLTSGSPAGKIVFKYGDDVFPPIKRLHTTCTVEAYVSGDRVFLDSRVRMAEAPGSGPSAAARRVKALFRVEGAPVSWTVLWRVGD